MKIKHQHFNTLPAYYMIARVTVPNGDSQNRCSSEIRSANRLRLRTSSKTRMRVFKTIRIRDMDCFSAKVWIARESCSLVRLCG